RTLSARAGDRGRRGRVASFRTVSLTTPGQHEVVGREEVRPREVRARRDEPGPTESSPPTATLPLQGRGSRPDRPLMVISTQGESAAASTGRRQDGPGRV